MVVGELLQDYGIPSEPATVIGSAITLVVTFIAIYLVGRFIFVPLTRRVIDRRELDDHAKKPLLKISYYIVYLAAAAGALAVSGFGSLVSALATIGAAGTLAIGFAMRSTIENFVSGIFIYTDKPFEIGDWIEWNGNSGRVDEIGLRVTRVTTFDNEQLTVPNSDLANAIIKNPVANDTLRIQLLFGIGYEDDINEATQIILEEAEAAGGVLDDPEPVVRLTELADSYVGLNTYLWINNPSRPDSLNLKSEFQQTIKERFDEAGIDMPYPYTELTGGIEVNEIPPDEAQQTGSED